MRTHWRAHIGKFRDDVVSGQTGIGRLSTAAEARSGSTALLKVGVYNRLTIKSSVIRLLCLPGLLHLSQLQLSLLPTLASSGIVLLLYGGQELAWHVRGFDEQSKTKVSMEVKCGPQTSTEGGNEGSLSRVRGASADSPHTKPITSTGPETVLADLDQSRFLSWSWGLLSE